jgi:hypothetical protein
MYIDILQDDILKLMVDGILIDDCYTGEKNVRIHCMLMHAVADYRGMPELTHQMGHPALIGACWLCGVIGHRLRDNRTTVYPHICRLLPIDSIERQWWHDAMVPDTHTQIEHPHDPYSTIEVSVISLPPFKLKTEEDIKKAVEDVETGRKKCNEAGVHSRHTLSKVPNIKATLHFLNCCMHMLMNTAKAAFSYACAYHDLQWKFRKHSYTHSRFKDSLNAVYYICIT